MHIFDAFVPTHDQLIAWIRPVVILFITIVLAIMCDKLKELIWVYRRGKTR